MPNTEFFNIIEIGTLFSTIFSFAADNFAGIVGLLGLIMGLKIVANLINGASGGFIDFDGNGDLREYKGGRKKW